MTPSFLAVMGIGLLLGLRHAFEPDHLAAVSTLATRPGARLWSAARLGLVWGLGHTTTVGVVALLIIALGVRGVIALAPRNCQLDVTRRDTGKARFNVFRLQPRNDIYEGTPRADRRKLRGIADENEPVDA